MAKDFKGGIGESGKPRSRDGIKISPANRGQNFGASFIIPIIILAVFLVIILPITIFYLKRRKMFCFKARKVNPKEDEAQKQVEMEMITNPRLKGKETSNQPSHFADVAATPDLK